MKASNSKNKQGSGVKRLPIVIVCIVVIVVIIGVALAFHQDKEPSPAEDVQQGDSSVALDAVDDMAINLGSGMYITAAGAYTGPYMEDGTDEFVSGVMMITVENQGEDTIQYAEIRMPVGEQEAFFSLSTLTPGSRVVLLEQTRMEYVAKECQTALAENVVLFDKPLSLREDQLKIQILDGAINVTNISEADISEDIMIYYKNSAPDAFYGGITYRVPIEGGLKAGEIRQIMAEHFSESGSTIMFVTCGGE